MGARGPGATPVKGRKPPQSKWRLPARPRAGETDADFLIRWIESLPVPSGILAGERFALQDWQKDFLRDTYPADRAVTLSVLSVPRKNGKTGLAAALALAHLCGPMAERQGEVYSAANDRAQAAITYRAMRAIIRSVPQLEQRLLIRDFDRSIEDSVTGSTYMALSADVPTKHGLSASFVVYDEYGQARNSDLYHVLETSLGARARPMMLVISTQAPDDSHPFSELLDDVLANRATDPAVHGVLYAAPADADIHSPDTWAAANPALGTFRNTTELASLARRVERMPSRRAAFRNLYLNQRVAQDATFLPAEEWHECGGAVDRVDLIGSPCYVGIDLAQTVDLNAVAAYFPDERVVIADVWASSERVEGATAPYAAWAAAGHLRVTPGRSVNKRDIALHIGALMDDYDVRAVVVDRWGMAELERLLDEEGIVVDFTPFGQGYKDMSPAVATLETMVLDRQFTHEGNPLVTWCFSNLQVDTDPAGNRKFSKKRATGAIDPIIAVTMTLQAALDVAPPYTFAGSVIAV